MKNCEHRCRVRHRTYQAVVRCAIPNHAGVTGEGPYGLITWCRVPVVTLWKDLVDAEKQQAAIAGACGYLCVGNHEIVLVTK